MAKKRKVGRPRKKVTKKKVASKRASPGGRVKTAKKHETKRVPISKLKGPVSIFLKARFGRGEISSRDQALNLVVTQFGDRVSNHNVLREWVDGYCEKSGLLREDGSGTAQRVADDPSNAYVTDLPTKELMGDLIAVSQFSIAIGGEKRLQYLCKLCDAIDALGGSRRVLWLSKIGQSIRASDGSMPDLDGIDLQEVLSAFAALEGEEAAQ